jgi:hypothetical protein
MLMKLLERDFEKFGKTDWGQVITFATPEFSRQTV